MIRIHHVLKDGTQVEAVEGHVVKMKDHPALYQMIKCMERKEKQGGKPGNRGFSGVENGQEGWKPVGNLEIQLVWSRSFSIGFPRFRKKMRKFK